MSTVALPDTAWLLPLGRALGPREDAVHHEVLAARVVQVLDPVDWVVWALCHGLPGEAGPWTAGDLRRQTLAAGTPDVDPVLAGLVDRGLVLTADPGEAALHRVRAGLVLLALGNTADEPEVWSLGAPGLPVVGLDRATFDVVTSAHRFPDLAAAVTAGAAAAFRAGLPAVAGSDAGVLAERVADALPLLLAVGAVHLDAAAGSALPTGATA